MSNVECWNCGRTGILPVTAERVGQETKEAERAKAKARAKARAKAS